LAGAQASARLPREDYGVHVGSTVTVPFYAAGQAKAYNNAVGAPPPPRGPVVTFTVVGLAAAEFDFPSGAAPTYNLFTTPAFASLVVPRTARDYFYAVRLKGGPAAVGRFEASARALGAATSNEDSVTAAVQASIHPQALGWWALAALSALVGLAVMAQALARQSGVEAEDYPTLSALGAQRRQLVTLGLARSSLVGAAGAMGAIVVATALSPLAPLGEARIAEDRTGAHFDTPVLLLGGLATLVAVVLLGAPPALAAARARLAPGHARAPRPSAVVGLLSAAGAPLRPSSACATPSNGTVAAQPCPSARLCWAPSWP
jgi:hypothetical protein